jgi:hypothetical protein
MSSARAQWQLTGDAGVAHLEQSAIPTSNALTAGASLEAYGSRTSLRSSALIAFAGSNRSTAQAIVLGSLLGPPQSTARWELTGAVSGFGESNAGSTVSGEGLARLRFESEGRGFALGAGGGAIAHSGEADGLFHAQGDAYVHTNAGQWIASLSAVSIPSMTGEQFIVDGSSLSANAIRGLSYGDAALGWRQEHSAIEADATAGVRAGFHGVVSTGAWGAANAAFWFTQQSAIVFGVGRTLDDATRGVPRTTYASVSLRFAARPHLVRSAKEEVGGPRLTVVPVAGGGGLIEVRGVEATRLEVMGDFTEWKPVELERDGSVWRLERAMTPGLHRIAIRVDGGEWVAPANLPRATDELGGVIGLITVP